MAKSPENQAIGRSPAEIKRPLTTVDVVIFAAIEGRLQVLLVRRWEDPSDPFPGRWALPGGFVDVDRDPHLEACALRKLKDKTGLDSPYLEQLGSWGGKSRDPRGWSATHAYFSLIPADIASDLAAGGNSVDARWSPVSGDAVAEPLAFDHGDILSAAVLRLRSKVEYTSLPAYLLPKEFTLTELQKVYETVLGRPLEKSAFRTRVLSAGLVVPVPRLRQGANRPARLYKLKSQSKPVIFQRTFKPADN